MSALSTIITLIPQLSEAERAAVIAYASSLNPKTETKTEVKKVRKPRVVKPKDESKPNPLAQYSTWVKGKSKAYSDELQAKFTDPVTKKVDKDGLKAAVKAKISAEWTEFKETLSTSSSSSASSSAESSDADNLMDELNDLLE